MGPCHRHKIEDVVAVCVGLSRHLPNFPKFVCRNILWYGSTCAQILLHLSTLISVMFSILSCSPVCHVLAGDNAHPHNTDKREHSQFFYTMNCAPQHHPPMPPKKAMGAITQNHRSHPHRNTMIIVVVLGCGPIWTGKGAAHCLLGCIFWAKFGWRGVFYPGRIAMGGPNWTVYPGPKNQPYHNQPSGAS
jgi:hypothetical protein